MENQSAATIPRITTYLFKRGDSMKTFPLRRWVDEIHIFFLRFVRVFVYFVAWKYVISIYCSIQSSKSSEASIFRQQQKKIKLSIQCENIKRVETTMTSKCREVCNKNSIRINISINDGYLRHNFSIVFFFFVSLGIFHEFFECFYYCLPSINCLANWIWTLDVCKFNERS